MFGLLEAKWKSRNSYIDEIRSKIDMHKRTGYNQAVNETSATHKMVC